MRPRPDYTLYLVTDRALAGDRPLERIVLEAVRGGATVVQVREKDCLTDEFIRRARPLREALRRLGVPLIVNDDVEAALALDADGVHIGQGDMPWPDARRRIGPDRLLGLSVDALDQLAEADAAEVDYVGLGPIFATATKPDAGAPLGVGAIREARWRTRKPIVAIGGIGERNASDVMAAGADGIAVVSAICAAPDPFEAARRLRAAAEEGRRSCSARGAHPSDEEPG